MRIKESNYRLVPVYNVRNDQYSAVCGDPCEAILKTHRHEYPPFQLIFDTDQGDVQNVLLTNKCTGSTVAVEYLPTHTRYTKDTDQDGVDEYVYVFGGGFYTGTLNGVYEVKIVFESGDILYTETFLNAPCQADQCNKNWHLEWWHSCSDKGLGDYDMNFINTYNLGDIVIQHEGELESVVSRRDGFGVETIVSRDNREKLSFEIQGTSWLLSSLRYLNKYDNVFLHRNENSDNFRIENIEVVPKGNIDDCFFVIKVIFTKDALITTKCCDSVYEQAPVPGNCAGMSVMVSEDFSICNDEDTPVEITATVTGGAAPFVYVWSNGETGQTIEVLPTETTTYIVTAIDAFGCVKQDEVTISVVSCEGVLEATITPDPVGVICAGDEVDLDLEVTGGSGTYTYLWSTGETTQDITVTPTMTTVYSVTITDTVSGDVLVENINIVVVQLPDVTIIANECDLSIQFIEACEGDPTYQWQKETVPDTWIPASGTNNGTTYSGFSGETYRLAVTCDGCTGYSNEITVECFVPCTVEINSILYEDENLTVQYTTDLGSAPFSTGILDLRESVDPGCGSYGFNHIITITLTSESDTLVIPYIPTSLDKAVLVSVQINAAECVAEQCYEIPG